MARKKATESAVNTVEAAKVEAIETKTENIKAEETVAEPKAAETEAAGGKKAPAKKAASKTETSKTTKKTTTQTAAKKPEVKCTLHVQYAGKSCAEEELMKIAKEAWKSEHKQKAGDLASIELYVKPEENKVYYVMNGEVKGSFDI